MYGRSAGIAIGNIWGEGEIREGMEALFGREGFTLRHKWCSQTCLKVSAGVVVKAVLDRVATRTCENMEMQIKEQLVMLFTK